MYIDIGRTMDVWNQNILTDCTTTSTFGTKKTHLLIGYNLFICVYCYLLWL